MGFRAMLSCLVGTHCLCYKKATEIKQVVVVVAQAQNHLGPCIRTAAFEDVVFQYQNHAEQAKKKCCPEFRYGICSLLFAKF